MSTTIPILPVCVVRGLVRRNAMCSQVGVSSDKDGNKACHQKGECEHKQDRKEQRHE